MDNKVTPKTQVPLTCCRKRLDDQQQEEAGIEGLYDNQTACQITDKKNEERTTIKTEETKNKKQKFLLCFSLFFFRLFFFFFFLFFFVFLLCSISISDVNQLHCPGD